MPLAEAELEMGAMRTEPADIAAADASHRRFHRPEFHRRRGSL